MSVIDSISQYPIYPFEKVRRKIPDRQKHLNTFIFVSAALMLAEIPLVGGIRKDELTQTSFKVSGTLMQLGTHPFVFASMISPMLFDKKENKHGDNLLGLLLGIVQACQWGYNNGSWFGALELCAITFALLQAEVYLEDRGSISPSTALIFANGARRVLVSLWPNPFGCVWTVVVFVFVVWVEKLFVTIPLTHMKSRSETTSMPLPVMYNSTTSLIVYYTVVEALANVYEPAQMLLPRNVYDLVVAAPCFYVATWFINRRLPSFNNQTAKDLVQGWRKEKFTLKGWRDPSRMYTFVQNIMDRNIHWNTIFICVLWTLTVLYPTTLSISTLFIMASTIKQQKVQLV